MTPKEKAREVFNKYAKMWHASTDDVKECCQICVDEIISSWQKHWGTALDVSTIKYWQEVKTELEKL